MKLTLILFFLCLLVLTNSVGAIESLNGFLVSGYDDRFRVVSPEKFHSPMEVIIENKTLVRLIGKVIVNSKVVAGYVAIEPEKYQKVAVNLKKGDVLHFIPLSPSFQEVELIVGNKNYEIPPKK
jgi:hypothetical protein